MIGESAGKSFAYLLGTYLGDGCVSKAQGYLRFTLSVIDMDFALAVKNAILDIYPERKVGIWTFPVRGSDKPTNALYCGSQELCKDLVRITDGKQKIPTGCLLLAPKEFRLAFISGLMDSEGFVAANKSNPTNRRYYMGYKSCDKWVPDFIKVLESVGVKIGKVSQEKPRKEGYKTPTRFTIKMQSWIDSGCRFNIKRKQARVDEWASYGPYEKRAKYARRLTPETIRQTAIS